jgi:microcystin-dependent protein
MTRFRVVDAAEGLWLTMITDLAYTLHLFTNDVTAGLTPDEIDQLEAGDFDEATFTGYAEEELDPEDWTVTAGNPTRAVNVTKAFASTADQTPEEVRGHYITVDAFGDALVAFEQYDAPLTIEFEDDGVNVLPTLTLDDKEGNVVPTGSILAYAVDSAATPPTGWLLCDGSAVSRSTFAELFAVIGEAYGIGDGATTFNLPDTRQRFILGQADSGTGVNVGDTGGDIDHVHGLDTASSHARVSFITSGPPHGRMQRKTVASWNETVQLNATSGAGGSSATTLGAALGGDSDDGNPPFVVATHIIKS